MIRDTNRGKIVEKSWKVPELRKTACPARFKKQVDAKTVFPGKLPPKQPSIPDTLMDFEVESRVVDTVFHDFPRFFHDLRLKTVF